VTRMISAVFVALVAFAAVFAVSMSATTAGLVPDDAVTLWASAITAGDGQMPIGRIVAAYPTIPFLAATLLEFVTPAGTPTTILLTAGVLALLAGGLFVSFRRTGVPPIGGTLMVFLIVLHPAVLRAAIAGPADIIFTVFLFLLGGALFDLRARSAAPEIMAVALSLLGLAFSHPMGAAIACAAIPLFVFSVRPELLTSLTLNLVMTLVFPTAFCVAAFSYMSWVFPGSGWSFLIAPAEGVATWAAGFSSLFGRGLTGSLALDAGIAVLVTLLLAAPLVPFLIIWVWERTPLLAPALVIVAMTAMAASLAVLTGLFGDPAPLAAMPPILAAILIMHVPLAREQLLFVLPLLVLGWFGGLAGFAILDPRGAMNVGVALMGRNVDMQSRQRYRRPQRRSRRYVQCASHRARSRARTGAAAAVHRRICARRDTGANRNALRRCTGSADWNWSAGPVEQGFSAALSAWGRRLSHRLRQRELEIVRAKLTQRTGI